MAWIVEVPPPEPRSVLPTGGTPSLDAGYLAWRDGLLSQAHESDVAARWHAAADRPAEGLEAWRFDRALYVALRGPLPLFGDADMINYQHRLRFLSVCLATRRRETARAAARFLSEVSHL